MFLSIRTMKKMKIDTARGFSLSCVLMKRYNLPFGKETQALTLPAAWDADTLESSHPFEKLSFEDMVRRSLENPIASPRLKDTVSPGQKICIVFSDITRSWQQTGRYLPLIVEELEAGGIKAEDITLLCALGTHRTHTEDEKKALAGSLYGRCRFIDHDCDDEANLVSLGTTSRGTAVEINRAAVECDQLIITGGIVFHLMAGYSGGRKSVLPGISSRKTIMANHALSLHPEKGKGSHPDIGCDKLENNPLHKDLEEAIDLLKPSFLVNIVPGMGDPGAVVSGHYRKAHEAGCALLREFFLIPIPEERDIVIASAGGFPGDINFYQTVKSMINGCQALKPGGTLILAARCHEGLGNPLMEEMIADYPDMAAREAFLRANYTIGRFIAYYGCELASRYRVLLVSDMDEPSLVKADIRNFRTLQEALDSLDQKEKGEKQKAWIIPDASHSFPALD